MKVFLDSIGCRLNQSEIEQIAHDFLSAGHELVSNAAEADLTVINTCSVTARAAADSRSASRRAVTAGTQHIVLTGCWSTMHPEEAAALPNVSHVIPNSRKPDLVFEVNGGSGERLKDPPIPIRPIPGPRRRTRRFIKAQDGCNLQCSYCITTLARGKAHSVLKESVVRSVQQAVEAGTMEVVLTGVHLGSWGHDLSPRRELRDLLDTILEETGIPRIRLSSIEPWSVTPTLLGVWENPRMCRSLHIPLQSGSANVLRRMGRRTTPDAYLTHLEWARERIPDIHISTDIIVGFPGETQIEFEESLDFIQECEFAGGHIFTYSEREGTRAATLPDPVPFPLRKERNRRVGSIIQKSADRYRNRFLGCEVEVLWESGKTDSTGGWEMSGYSDNYLRVRTETAEILENKITNTRLNSIDGSVIIGEVRSDHTGEHFAR